MTSITKLSTAQKIWELLTSAERRGAVVLLGLIFIGMVLETLGIGLVIPAIGLLTQRDFLSNYPALEPALHALGNPSQQSIVVGGLFMLAGVSLIKALFLTFLAWRQARFGYGAQSSFSQRLFAGYLNQPWAFHLQRNSAQLIRNVTTEVGLFGVVIQNALVVFTEGMATLGIWMLLVAVEPVGTLLVMTTIGLAAWFFHHLTRAHLLHWGEARQYHEGLRMQHLQQGLFAAKEVKLLGREEDFLARFSLHNIGIAHVAQRQLTIQQMPRLWLELLAVVGLAALVLVMLRLGKPLDALLPILGLFAGAAFRVLPSINRVLGAIQSIRYCLPVVNTLHQEMALFDASAAPKRIRLLPFWAQLALTKVSYRYPNAAATSLRDVSLTVAHGTTVGFIGSSGAGKTTLIDVILGLLSPSSGQVTVDGVDIQTNLRGWQDQIGYVPQFIFLTDDTLRRNVAFGIPDDQIDHEAVRRAIRAAQLDDFVNGLPQGLDTLVGERGVRLSGGQRQRIGIARALYHDPAILVLDEATSSLDIATEGDVMQAVYALRGHKTFLIVAHRLSTVANCDLLFWIEEGRVVNRPGAGTARKVAMAKDGSAGIVEKRIDQESQIRQ
ncbi:ABC transporter ATP-binding protein [Candidatus Methylomirabilis sp.]|uniref:ABC transporter ATP-binding protein n=1 Tax=Candidatus Methylomirabilis sp. TaxID=2032687 RepID=UPI002A5FC19E|nr:ABC transporter ATP-binding protein [Candidatus Methylomirabilis sp.]